jgi:acyl-CoA thioesterase I
MQSATLYVILLAIVLGGCRVNEESPTPLPPAAPDARSENEAGVADRGRVLVLGNSIAAGYGLDPQQAFPAVLQEKIDSAGLPFTMVNAGVSGETTAGGLRRIDWLLREPVEVFILELGGNDGLRGLPVEETRQNLLAIIERVRDRYPEAAVLLAGMQIPTNLGAEYTAAFRDVYPDVARESNAILIPFLLEGVGGVPELNLPDRIHPTARGQRIIAGTVWNYLEPVLEERVREGEAAN